MNYPAREVLKEVISGLLIMKPHKVRNKMRRRKRTMTSDRVLARNRLFRCHKKETKSREKKGNRETQQKIRHRIEEKNEEQCIIMHEHVMCKRNCIMGKNPIQIIALTLVNQAHNLECMKT